MKRTSGILFAALLTANVVSGAESPQGSTALPPLATLPTTWSFLGNGGPLSLPGRCDIGYDTQMPVQMAMDGPAPFSVRCTSNVLPSFGGARMNHDAKAWRGKRVRVSGSVMTAGVESVANAQYPNVAGEAGLWIGIGTPQGGLKSDRMADRTIKGSNAWRVMEFVVDVPADADRLQAGFWMQGKGQMWVRDIKVEEVPTTVAVNFSLNAPRPDSLPDLSLAPTATARAGERFLPPPAKWLAMGETNFELCDIGIDAKMLAAGQRNLSIACTVPVRANLRHVFEAATWWGKRVRLSAWIKTENVKPKAAASEQPDAREQPAALLFLATTADRNGTTYFVDVPGTSDWVYREIVVDIPAGSAAPYIPMGLTLVGTGQMWARDLKFEEVSHDVPVTRLPSPLR